MNLSFFKKSRPRFWLYLFGPYLIGVTVASEGFLTPLSPLVIILGFYFTFPANFLIYGVNDISDSDTDQFNPKKEGYELRNTTSEHRKYARWILFFNIPILSFIPFLPFTTNIALIAFFFFGIFYSLPPIRAKTIPFLDSFFNILYVFPGIVGYSVITNTFPALHVCIAATAWCMAMHAYSAIPDIEADTKASLQTIATRLGQTKTLLWCSALYTLAGTILIVTVTPWFTIPLCIYLGLMAKSFRKAGVELFRIYTWFPLVNTCIGTALFFFLLTFYRFS
jgi:4-hydroxybenzoate polyprenyltransferase